ncbi:carbonic anhydrase [Cladophialophora yegresii CBS 114405]|uniref:Carbonic anhydrase n=1 Tax=Cladophialophora yegresii CBS 114405 TaxID=1182544 RepID=W9W2N7_9EURO|nr:carbonic anhydrase [Cladophialophora yegresii CBS 114405]EXJ59275.1 carbonic anhydrase [Cladophialophora yegresii CBS 114405]
MSKPSPPFSIVRVRNATQLADIISLFYAYAASLGIDLAFQNFDGEMASMPGRYSPPEGELLLARDEAGQAIGCVGLRPLPSTERGARVCEMKRLYVSPAGRGSGVGKALASTIIAAAEELGYSEMRLDTLPSMVAALNMYRAIGFEDIPAYYETPLEGTHFLALKLPMQKAGAVAASRDSGTDTT